MTSCSRAPVVTAAESLKMQPAPQQQRPLKWRLLCCKALVAAAAFSASSEASIGDPHAFNHFKSVRGSASSSVGVNAEQEVASESASCHGLQLRLWIAAAVTTDCHTDKRVACWRPLLAFCSLPLIPAAAAEVVRVWMVALRRSLIVARSVSSETKAKEIHAATGTKVNDRWATFFTDGVVSSCLLKCYIATAHFAKSARF